MRKTDYSNAFANNFIVYVDKLPNLEFFITNTPLPDVSIDGARVNTRYIDFDLHGDNLEFQPLSLSFIVDEYYHNYEEVYNWIYGQANPTVVSKTFSPYTDIYIILLDNNKNPFGKVHFIDAFPITLDGPVYELQQAGNVEPITITAQFSYTEFRFTRTMEKPEPNPRKDLELIKSFLS